MLNNIHVRGKWIAGPERYLEVGDNLVTDEDPGFVDAKGKDFRFKDLAAIQKQLPGFKPIPFEEIGLKTDEYRTVK